MQYQAPRGTADLLPAESFAWRHLINQFAQLAESFGYSEISTPIFEDAQLFIRSSGETSDVVTKQMYEFQDKGGRLLCLKPEGTAPVIRAFLEHKLGTTGDLTRLWYFTHIFRYERPQKGRMRQGHQLGLELIGSPSPLADAEVIELTMRFYDQAGVAAKELKLNSIGDAQDRARYREKLIQFAGPYLQSLDEEARTKALQNPLRLLDSKDPKAIEHFAGAPSILDSLSNESRQRFDQVCQRLTDASVPYTVEPTIVRGLDYYCDTVFEITSTSLGAQSSLCGGGRYDHLVKEMGGPQTPCFGMGLGIERLLIALEAEGKTPTDRRPRLYFVRAVDEAQPKLVKMAKSAREFGYICQLDIDDSNLKRQMKLADRFQAGIAVILGEDELQSKQVTLKKLETGEQRQVQEDRWIEELAAF